MKKVKKVRKIKILPFIITIISIIVVFGVFYLISLFPITNIYIKGNNYLNDDYIIELADIKNYPNFILMKTRSREKKVSKSKYIDSCNIIASSIFSLVITINNSFLWLV